MCSCTYARASISVSARVRECASAQPHPRVRGHEYKLLFACRCAAQTITVCTARAAVAEHGHWDHAAGVPGRGGGVQYPHGVCRHLQCIRNACSSPRPTRALCACMHAGQAWGRPIIVPHDRWAVSYGRLRSSRLPCYRGFWGEHAQGPRCPASRPNVRRAHRSLVSGNGPI